MQFNQAVHKGSFFFAKMQLQTNFHTAPPLNFKLVEHF
jgi:hypothetical protein